MPWKALPRTVPFLLLLMASAGCYGKPAAAYDLPHDFTDQQSMGAGPVLVPHAIEVKGPTHLNATLVWEDPRSSLTLEVSAGGSSGGGAAVSGTVARLQQDLYPGTYELTVRGQSAGSDVWHLEAHFTRI